jgi:hypothetical protein
VVVAVVDAVGWGHVVATSVVAGIIVASGTVDATEVEVRLGVEKTGCGMVSVPGTGTVVVSSIGRASVVVG